MPSDFIKQFNNAAETLTVKSEQEESYMNCGRIILETKNGKHSDEKNQTAE